MVGTLHSSRDNDTQADINLVALGEWETAYRQAIAFAADLTLSQKASIVNGLNATSPSTGEFFPGMRISDGQQGPQNQYFVTGWGQPAALSMTFDRDAMYQQARSVAIEFYTRGYDVADGPTSAPLGRIAWGGRQSDAWAFDPYLNGIVFGIAARAEMDVGVLPSGKVSILEQASIF